MHQAELAHKILSVEESAVLRTLLYFSVFNYPLTEKELLENSVISCSRSSFKVLVSSLEEKGLLQRQGEFLQVSQAGDSAILRRLRGNTAAAAIMDTVHQYSRRIASFPFVRGVCISGALSKNYYDDKGDIDYFILASPGRLWICRTLLILRYKLLPASRKKFWCVNYFVSVDQLLIPDQNAFTATELSHLIPTYNYSLYRMLLSENAWYKNWYPNKEALSNRHCVNVRAGFLKRLVEGLFSGWGNWLDDALLKFTLQHWRKKYPLMSEEDFQMQFRSRKTVCKRHTTGYQYRVLQQWEQKQRLFETAHKIRLS